MVGFRIRVLRWAVYLLGTLGLALSAVAQTPPVQLPPPIPAGSTGSTSPLVTESLPLAGSEGIQPLQQLIAERQQQLTTDAERPVEVKEALSKLYEQAQIDLATALKAQQQRSEWNKSAAAAPALLDATRARLAAEPSKNGWSADSLQLKSFEEVEQLRQSLEADLAVATSERTALSDRSAKREKRRKELPQLISEMKAKQEQLDSLPATDNGATEPLVSQAVEWAAEAANQSTSEQLQALESEQRLYEAEAALLPLQLELAQRTEKKLQDQLRIVEEQLNRIRTDRILTKYSEARDLLRRLPADLSEEGQQLVDRIEKWIVLAKKQAILKAELTDAKALLSRWSEKKTRMNSRVDPKPGQEAVSGFNSWVGLMLRKQRSELPNTRQMEARIRYYQTEMQATDSLLFDIEEALVENKSQLANLEQDEQAPDSNASTNARREALNDLLKQNDEVMNAIKIDVSAYLSDLYDIADVRDNTITLSEQYREFIDKHVLWIRSTDPLSLADWPFVVEAFRWLMSYTNWRSVGTFMLRDLTQHPILYVLLMMVIIVFVANQAGLRRRLGQIASKAEKNNCTDFSLTARSLLITCLIAAPVSLLLVFAYWRLSAITRSSLGLGLDVAFPDALAHGLLVATAAFVPLELLRQLSRPGGLGIKHFGWREKSAQRLGRNLRWLIDFTVPLAAMTGLFLSQSNQRWEAAFGRVAFILTMPLLSVFVARIFSPKSGIISGYIEQHKGGWLDRLSVVWYPTLIVGPLILAVVSYIGYDYTAQRLAAHVLTSLWTLVVLLIVHCLMMRWLVLKRRKLMLAQARQRLEDASRREASAEAPAAEDQRLDLVAINEQTKRLVTSLIVATGFVLAFFIWSDVLPAVSMLDRFELWTVQGSVPDESVTITLSNLLLVIPIIVLLIIAGRNVPGLLEIAFLQHLPLTSAARYAITTLSRYAIFGVGIILVSSTIGLRWSSIQWLVAALGVGLGFGLQEIFANFVSGIILLFEQPIRVGDIVSVDGVTGSVSKIRMRATTLVNWDRQELIIPNKELISGKLLNWTLSDETNRITINVGVAYGSDTQRASELILEVCKQHPKIMSEPHPSVTFEGFGDNSLNLVLRAFLDSLQNRLTTIHELHQQIYESFNAAGIEIAFPQRDLHVRSLPKAWTRWLERSAPPSVAASANEMALSKQAD